MIFCDCIISIAALASIPVVITRGICDITVSTVRAKDLVTYGAANRRRNDTDESTVATNDADDPKPFEDI